MQISILDLNCDVLYAILSFFNGRSLVEFTATCQSAYDAALPHLVSSVQLRRSVKQVLDFCNFMLSERHNSRTLPMLRSLRIGGISFRGLTLGIFPKLDVITTVLQQAHNLKTLEIGQIQWLLECQPRIYDAIVQLPCLTSIYFTAADQQSLDMISRMHGLRHIHVSHDTDLLPAVRPFQETLETMSSEYQFFRNDKDLLSLADTDQWPHVHTLNLGLLAVQPQCLVRAFPNLRRLRLQGITRTLKSSPSQTNECWSSLDYVEGPVAALHEMAFSCPIREVRLSRSPELVLERGEDPVIIFLELVRTTMPTALYFPIPRRIESLFRQLAADLPEMKVLGLSLVYDPMTTFDRLVCMLVD